MAEALKLVYSEHFFTQLIDRFRKVNSNFDQEKWDNQIYIPEWDSLELKQRMRHIARVIGSFLNDDFSQSHLELISLFKAVKEHPLENSKGFELMFFPDFVEVFGMNHFTESMKSMEEITTIASCEFAIRPFLIKYPEKALKQMILWSKHEIAMVRRLSTEGCRPRLPWAMALPEFKKNPNAILPILKRLRNDTSESVRRSVANNLNDISKDNPEIMFDLISSWKGESKEVDWVMKHASRTLLKQGYPKAMVLFGYCDIEKLEFSNFKITTSEVVFGETLEFDFELENLSNKEEKVRVEYGVYFLKANGNLARKVFKISETTYQSKQRSLITRKHKIKPISTRKYYFGNHELSIIINGIEFPKMPFVLKE